MIDDPVTNQDSAKQNQSGKEARDARDEKSDADQPADSAAGAKPKQESSPGSAEEYIKEDHIKNDSGDAGQSGPFGDLLRAARDFPGAINVFFRNGGVDFNADARIYGDVTGRDKIARDDAIGRDKIVIIKQAATAAAGNDAETGISGQVCNAEIEKIVNVYAEAALYQRARQRLQEKHLLILCGEPDTGKRATAIRLLESFHQKTIFEIAPTLDDLTKFHCQNRQGYLWNTPGGEKLERVSRFTLDQISGEHRKQGSHLVITLDRRARLAPETAHNYLLEWNECPDSSAILEKHLAWYLKGESEQASDQVSALRQQENITAIISELSHPAKAGRLAELLIQVARGDLSLEELLSAFADLDRQDAQAWFDKHQSLSRRLQMLALAILQGSSHQRIIEAGRELRYYLKLHTDEAPDFSTEAEMNTSSKQWLGEMEAKTTLLEISAEYGRDYIEAVVFKKPKFQQAVLAYAWEEFAEWRLPLLRWLRDQGASHNLEARLAAVAASSELSQYHAFRDVKREVLIWWAKSDDYDQRRMAAFALMLQALDRNLSAQSLGLLHHWATIHSNWQLQCTAAAAYGSELGASYPELAMRDLFEVFRSNDPRPQIAVYNTLRFLFVSGRQQPNLYAAVLRALESWARDQRLDKSARKLAVLIFLKLSELKVRVEEDGGVRPTVLWLATLDQTYARQFRSMLREALTTSKVTREELLVKRLPEWLGEADNNEEMFRLVGQALYSIVKARDQNFDVFQRILYERLERLASDETSRSAGKLLTVLKRDFPI